MGFLSLWPLALLLLVAGIIILYILRQDTTQRDFSSTLLWREMLRNTEATKPWERLRKNLLLFLQILTMLLIILALMGPWIKGLGRDEQRVVLVIDNSASMGAFYTEKSTRLEAAKEAAISYVDEAKSGAAIYIISGNQQAVLELVNGTDKLEAKNRINAIEQTDLAGDLSCAVGLVESCMSKDEKTDVVFFTDSSFELSGIEASVASFYSDMPNCSIDGISYAYKDGNLLLLSQITNYSGQEVSREVNIYGVTADNKEELLDVVSVEVMADDTAAVYTELTPAKVEGYTAIKGEINEKDGLLADNECWCVLTESTDSRVLLVSKSNMFVEKAFENLSGVEIFRTDDMSVIEGKDKYDLYIFDGELPKSLPESGNLMFINCEWEDICAAKTSAEKRILTIADREITSYVADTEVGVNKTIIYSLPAWGESYIDTTEGSAGFFGIYDGRRIVTMGFDLHQTDFGLQPEFPILMSNMSEFLLDRNLAEGSSFVAGDSIMLHGSTKGSDLTIVKPEGEKTTVLASEAAGSYFQVDRRGIYSISQELEDRENWQQISVLFPTALESRVNSALNMVSDNSTVKELTVHGGVLELRSYIIVLLLLLLMAEWIVYIRMQ